MLIVMGRIGSKQHESELKQYMETLEKNGFKVINLKGCSPDAIAVKDNKIYAVEVLGSQYRNGKGWHKSWTVKKKTEQYEMFDDLFIHVFRYQQTTRKA